MNAKLKSFLGMFVRRSYCDECGEHVKPTWRYWNDDGDQEDCMRCSCGNCWHESDHQGAP